ncbi:hypothetical protein [Synechococcus sp. EJ6-Ellesmere]|uniref:hypothetical protein n=1 Tax=Synechococcus sp. EJ6-Ellesmere TaxID=2823734 RepID=UPI0020CB9F18|nr:hypothetical protein [Synechococcus sp. EJ6-Ellesmere]MCP9826016.1 hypothetical protein [Synechococcus sp. EJ6-Ellesmere]
MASVFRFRSLARHSSDSLERLSFCCHSAVTPCRRLAELADQILFERQLLNPRIIGSAEVERELPF